MSDRKYSLIVATPTKRMVVPQLSLRDLADTFDEFVEYAEGPVHFLVDLPLHA